MNCIRASVVAFIAGGLIASSAASETRQPIPTPRDHHAIPLRTAPAASAHGTQEQWEEVDGRRTVSKVAQATLTPILPAPDKATGAAVIIIPDAAADRIEIDREGFRIARGLAEGGMAALVLKYRIRPTSSQGPGETHALADAQEALRVAKARAREMGVDPARIGVLGFVSSSATLPALGLDKPALRPAFVVSVRGASMAASAVPADAPPLFAVSGDERTGATTLVSLWREAGAPVHVHTDTKEGGGSGTRPDAWIESFHRWIASVGLATVAR